MSVKEGKGSVRKSKHMAVKTALNNPYALQWRTLDRGDMHFILGALEGVMKRIGFKKLELRRQKKPCSGQKQKKEQCLSTGKLQDDNESKEVQLHGWTNLQVRKQLAIGINEVTKALEKDELLLVLVCKSATPTLLTSHLIPLSVSRAIPAGQVPRLSERLAPVLGLTSVLALGFKRSADAFAEVAEMIIPRIPSLEVPWLHHGIKQSLGSEEDTVLMDSPAVELMESGEEKSSLNQKRKRLDNSKLASPNVVLQALKVKKVVPNPNKRRKLPKTKKRILK
ncbi:ribonuclease P protein subunit p38 [Sceloporus undulatus]|uniref:ribonuclease P protein subunit p38 n=1 Tax=Sceloporus undulatus TaxID=8520 RepID=UPI001C4C5D04|nr:ribonuclease P protein subunit p38 [Sceloporus undulatus]